MNTEQELLDAMVNNSKLLLDSIIKYEKYRLKPVKKNIGFKFNKNKPLHLEVKRFCRIFNVDSKSEFQLRKMFIQEYNNGRYN